MIRIKQVDWKESEVDLSLIRRKVFIEEQHVPEALEWDGEDPQAIHLLAFSNDTPIGTVRLLADGHLGRMAVLKAYRNRGVGRMLMSEAIRLARAASMQTLVLAAQTQALNFYLPFGFIAEGEIFMDAGIPHRQMRLQLELQ